MNFIQEIQRGIYGAALLGRFDTRGMEVFDISADGFWRSFIAVVITIPLYVAMLMMPAMGGQGAAFQSQMGIDVAARILVWLAVLLAMLGLAHLVKRDRQYATFVIAFNWFNVVAVGIQLSARAIASVFLGTAFEMGIILLATLYVVVFLWFVIRESLRIDTVLAILLLIVVLFVETLVDYGVGAVAGLEAVSG